MKHYEPEVFKYLIKKVFRKTDLGGLIIKPCRTIYNTLNRLLDHHDIEPRYFTLSQHQKRVTLFDRFVQQK